MSCYESMSGNGLLMKKDIKELKKKLMETHNKQIEKLKIKYQLTPAKLKKMGVKKATTKDTSFPFFYIYQEEDYDVKKNKTVITGHFQVVEGSVLLNTETGEFRFYTDENNHTVDHLSEKSDTFNAVLNFIQKLEVKGSKYGATTYYTNEYQEDGYGNRAEGDRQYYGGWVPAWQKKMMKPKKRA